MYSVRLYASEPSGSQALPGQDLRLTFAQSR